MDKQCWWVSWYQPTEDHRPIISPPIKLFGWWWCTGYRCHDEAATLVAFLEADNEKEAKKILEEYWPETIIAEWRFFDKTDKSIPYSS